MFRYEKSDSDKAKNKSYICGDEDEVHFNDSVADPGNYHCAPGKLLGFVKLNKEEHAIVMQCEHKHKQSGVFSTYWKLEYCDKRKQQPMVNLMDVNSMVRHCLMIPEGKDEIGYHEIWDQTRWANAFC